MVPQRRSLRGAISLGALGALLGCPLPIARTEAASAPVIGRLLREDGTPVAGASLAVSTEWDDGGCTSAVTRTRSDRSGRFELPGTEAHYRTTWFVPNLDRVAGSFAVCAGTGDTLQLSLAYTGRGSLAPYARPDTLSCVVWQWAERERVTCAGSMQRSVSAGGTWSDSAGAGFYRVLLTTEKVRVKGYDKDRPQPRPHVYVQWVDTTGAAAGGPHRIRATVLLPFDRNKVHVLHDSRLWRRGAHWQLSLLGYQKSFLDDYARAELVFALGREGEAALVAGP